MSAYQTRYTCPCGSPLHLIKGHMFTQLRCLDCLKDSGACVHLDDAKNEFERMYNCKLTLRPESESRDEVLQRAIDTYGREAQRDMMVEEMSELTKALMKLRRGGPVADVIEEMADVQIMLDQMKIIFGDTAEAEAAKVARLAERLNKREAGA